MNTRGGSSQSGQAAVESALILPLFVFLLLGTLQLSMMHQARLMTKYAAYKAVRAGALHNARTADMERAALAVLLPFISQGHGGVEVIRPVNSPGDFKGKWRSEGIANNRMPDTALPYVQVTTCGPTLKEVKRAGVPGKEVDFDDPEVAGKPGWLDSHLTKLRIQVTFNYRLPIPFANWLIYTAAMGRQLPLFPGTMRSRGSARSGSSPPGVYVLPIRAAYTMRMQSNLYTSFLPMENACVTKNRY